MHLTITELAWQAGVSDATVVSLQALGLQRVSGVQDPPGPGCGHEKAAIYGVEPRCDVETIREKIFQANITALQDTRRVLDKNALEATVQVMSSAGEIQFYGIGASGIVAMDAEQKFSRIGLKANAFVDSHMQITRAALLKPGDVAVGISYSGETYEIVEALQTAQRRATTIAITNFFVSPWLVQLIGVFDASQENILLGGPFLRVAQLSIIDTLFIAVALVDFSKSMHAIERTKGAFPA